MAKKLGDASFRFEAINDNQMVIRHFKTIGDTQILVDEFNVNPNDLTKSEVYNKWLAQAIFTTLSARVSQYPSAEKLAQMRETWDLWTTEGTWKSATRAGSGLVARTLILALAEVFNLTPEVALNSWKAANKETQDAIKAREDIQAAKLRLDAEAKKAEVVDLTDFT